MISKIKLTLTQDGSLCTGTPSPPKTVNRRDRLSRSPIDSFSSGGGSIHRLAKSGGQLRKLLNEITVINTSQ